MWGSDIKTLSPLIKTLSDGAGLPLAAPSYPRALVD